MSGSRILLAFEGPLAVLTLDRPEKLNALTLEMLDEIESALARIEREPGCRALVLEAAGERAFCVGADVRAWSVLAPVGMWQDWTRRGQDVFQRLAQMRLPSIAAIDGLALGGGLELAMACDLRIASARSAFAMPETSIGTVPGWGGTHRLPALVGVARAKQMILSGDRIDAQTACAWGLINEVAPDAAERARELARRIGVNAPLSVQAAKEILDAGAAPAAAERLERLAGGVCAASADGREGVDALLARRPPRFEGR